MCTGYHISLPFLSRELKSAIVENNTLKLYKNVFSPSLGPSIAFIGFVQPASGGVITMSETQARWWIEVGRGRNEASCNIKKVTVHVFCFALRR